MADNSETLLKYSEELVEVHGEQAVQEKFEARKKSELPSLEGKPSIEELLNVIFPPRVLEQEGRTFINPVCHEEASRKELDELEALLQQRLHDRQARNEGICPIRQEIHNELFDEIIRQCTINCPERGLLLLRVRDNLKMTFVAYQTLYQGSVVFGNRKAFSAHIGVPEMEAKIKELRRKKILLENKVRQSQTQQVLLENELEATEKSFREIRAVEEKRKADELTYLKNQTKHLEEYQSSLG